MSAPIARRVESLLDMSDKRGLIVEKVLVKGDTIEIVYLHQAAKPKGTDPDLIDWRRK